MNLQTILVTLGMCQAQQNHENTRHLHGTERQMTLQYGAIIIHGDL